MKGMHGPEEPISRTVILAIMPGTQEATVNRGYLKDVPVGEIAGFTKIYKRIGTLSRQHRITQTEEVPAR